MRLLIKVVLGLIVLVVVALVATMLIVNYQTRQSVEQSTSEAIGEPATLARAHVGIFTGNFTLTNLDVDNPEGFQSPRFLHMDVSRGQVRLGSLIEEAVELPHLMLSNIELHLERLENKSNFGPVLQNLRRTEDQHDENGRRFMIRELVLRDVIVHVNLVPEAGEHAQLRVPIEEMHLRDVGTEADRGLLMRDVAGEVIKALLAAALNVGDEIPQRIADELGAGLKELVDVQARVIELRGEVIGGLDDLLDDIAPDFDLDHFLPSRD